MAQTRKPILYQDLVDMVIDNIQDDKKALSSASLIARCWVKGSQKYLHNTISVTPRTDTWLQPGPTRQFERYTSPRIAQLVKNVLIRFNGTSFSREEIKVVVSRLTHVRNLILDNIDKWPQKGDDFNFEFDYLESLSITHSSFQDSKDFFHVLSLFPTIQIFVLLNVVWSSEDEDYIFGDPIPLPPDIPGSLIHQIIYGENNDELKLIDVLHQWFRAITLEGFDDIHFVWEGSFPDALGLLTDELGPDLTCLTLKFGNLIKDETLLGSMLKENTELETIELTDISLVSESLNPECREMKWIVKLMSNITSSDFKKVVFYLQIHVAANVQALPLASLDTVFSARKFDGLRHVNFIISWQHSELFREVLDILVKGLPRLHSRGLVSLSCDAD